jgi:hypothetical protein
MHAKRRDVIMRVGMLLGGVTLLVGLLWAFSGSGHDPNHGINMEKAKEAADRVKPPPPPGTKRIPGHGG